MIKKNSRKTYRGSYNCGGYALRTYTWFLPYQCLNTEDEKLLNKEDDLKEYVYEIWDEMDENVYDERDIKSICNNAASMLVDHMISAFEGKLREIAKVDDAKKDERVIAFRFGSKDFHYMIKGRVGHQWHSKMGASHYIDTFDEEYVMNSYDWDGKYYSDTFLMALSK